jgi:hypothetical protein
VFTRESAAVLDQDGIGRQIADGIRTYRAIQPRVDGVHREWTHHSFTRTASRSIPHYLNIYPGGAGTITETFRDLPDGANVLIMIRSYTGLATSCGTFRLLLKDLVSRRGMSFKVFFSPPCLFVCLFVSIDQTTWFYGKPISRLLLVLPSVSLSVLVPF